MDLCKLIFTLSLSIVLVACSEVPDSRISSDQSQDDSTSHEEFKMGQSVFITHCERCHNAPDEEVLDGFMWAGLFDRVPNGREYVFTFITSSSALRNDSDLYAIRIKEMWGSSDYEHEFSEILEEKELSQLMTYLEKSLEPGE